MTFLVDPITGSKAGRKVTAFLRGPINTTTAVKYALASEATIRNGVRYRPWLKNLPTPSEAVSDDESIQTSGKFTAEIVPDSLPPDVVTPDFYLNAMSGSIVPEVGPAPISYVLNSATYEADFENRLVQFPANAMRWRGMRVVRNLLTTPDDFSGWTFSGAGVGTLTKTLVTVQTPNGPVQGCRITGTTSSSLAYFSRVYSSLGLSTTRSETLSLWIQNNIAGSPSIFLGNKWGGSWQFCSVDTTARRFANVANRPGGTTLEFAINLTTVGAYDITIWLPQMEDVSGQSNVMPSENVRVGVLSWPYQGTGVDGIQLFNYPNRNIMTPGTGRVTEIDGKGQTLKWLFSPGRSGNYASTPDSAAVSVTGDIDLICYVVPQKWTSGVNQILVAKANFGAMSFAWYLRDIGGMSFQISTDGFAFAPGLKTGHSSTTWPFADGEGAWLRVTRVAATGLMSFYYSRDGGAWVSFGTDNPGAGNIFDNALPLTLGMLSDGANAPFLGRFGIFRLYNGIFGTLASEFDPARFSAGATSAVMSTGETWTINTSGTGNLAQIVEAFTPDSIWLSFEPTRNNFFINSQDVSAWTNFDAPTVTTNSTIAPDGTLTADTLSDTRTVAYQGKQQTFSVVNDSQTRIFSIYVLKTGGGTSKTFGITMSLTGGISVSAIARVNTDTGEYFTTGTTIVEDVGNWWRVTLKITNNSSGNTSLTVQIWPATGANGSFIDSVTHTGSVVLWQAQLEVTTLSTEVATSPIVTGASANSRNAPVLRYPTSLINDAEGTIYAEYMQYDWVSNVDARVIGTQISTSPLIASTLFKGAVSFDGTNTVSSGSGAPSGWVRGASAWTGNKLTVFSNGVAGTEFNYDGSFNATAVYLGNNNFSNTLHGGIRVVKSYDSRLKNAEVIALNSSADPYNRWNFEQLRDSIRGTTWDLELLTQLTRADGSVMEMSYACRAVAKGMTIEGDSLSVDFASIDLIAFDKLYPSLMFTKADWPAIFIDHENKPVADGVGTLEKIPLRWIVNSGGVWGYGGIEARAGYSYSILAVYRNGRLVNSSEYVAVTRTAPSGYSVFGCNFGSEQFDTNGTHYDLRFDVQVTGPGGVASRSPSTEAAYIMSKLGIAYGTTSVSAAASEDVTRGMLVDAVYVTPVAGRTIVLELLKVARSRLVESSTGALDFVQDKVRTPLATIKESSDMVEVKPYELPDPPQSVELKYRRRAADADELVWSATRNTGGGSEALRIENRYIWDHDVAQRYVDYISKREKSRRMATLRLVGGQWYAGDLLPIDGVSCFRGVRTFFILGGSRPGDANIMRAREYDSTIYTPDSYTLPTGATNGYKPDYSKTPPTAPTSPGAPSGGVTPDVDGKATAWQQIRAVLPSVNAIELWAQVRNLVTNATITTQCTTVNAPYLESKVPGLAPNVLHDVIFWAVNSNGVAGAVTSAVSFTSATYSLAPAAPTGLTISQTGADQITVKFTPVSSALISHYVPYLSYNGGAFVALPKVDAAVCIIPITAFGGSHAVKFKSVDKFGNESAFSSTVSITPTAYISNTHISPGGVGTVSLAGLAVNSGILGNLSVGSVKLNIASTITNYFGLPAGSIVTLSASQGLWSTVNRTNFTCVGGGAPNTTAWRNDSGGAANFTAYENYWV